MKKVLWNTSVAVASSIVVIFVVGNFLLLPFEVHKDGACAFEVQPSLVSADVLRDCGTTGALALGSPLSWELYQTE